MTDSGLCLDHVCVKRRHRTILSIDELRIGRGEFVGIVGTNGAGKSTLLKVACGLLRPRSGSVVWGDTHIGNLTAWSRTTLRRAVGYVGQHAEYNSDLPFTLREVVLRGRAGARGLCRSSRHDDDDLVDQWLEKLGLGDRPSQIFSSLSGGEQQKALIARAMVQQPAILMLDEPGASLDFNWKYELSRIVEQVYVQTQVTVVMVSHEIHILPGVCRRVLLLDKGRIVADGVAEDVLSSRVLSDVYGCRVETVELNQRRYAAIRKE